MHQPTLFSASSEPSSSLVSLFAQIPKVDLHVHLSGCLRRGTVIEVARGLKITQGASRDIARAIVLEQPAPSFAASFLPWRRVLNRVSEVPELSERLIYEVAEDFAHDGVVYAELRVSPQFPLQPEPFLALLESLDRGGRAATADHGVDIRLVLGITRHRFLHLDEATQLQYVRGVLDAADGFRARVVGFDLWGNEFSNPPQLFERVFDLVRARGYSVSVHAGEVGSPENIRQAVSLLGARRVGHGRLAVESPTVLELLRASQTTLEVCLSSNELTGVERDIRQHPLRRMIDEGLLATLASDNTLVYATTLSREYARAVSASLVTPEEVPALLIAAAASVFADDSDREALMDRLRMAVPPDLPARIRAASGMRAT